MATTKLSTTTKTEISISKLDHPQHYGDWHDKPLRYQVSGPRSECQLFATKKNALAYASIRRKSPDQLLAINAYIDRR